ncbi:MAG: hypothetical protein M1816_007742 [Peltula sp. TS41687]|nr:MAG: hypothetical protein M1816_007742 [Peltula sp. TS41687]
MDPFSTEGELMNMLNALHQGRYSAVTEFNTDALSPENELPARILQLRAKTTLGGAEEVIAEVEGEADDVPDLAAVKAVAQYRSGDAENAVEVVDQLAEIHPENATVQILCGTILQAEKRSDEALKLLEKHQHNLEAVTLIVQIHLSQNRTDLALKEVQSARRWAQDSLLVNIAESWVGLRVGGEKYQQAYYVFEELAQSDATSSTKSLLGQAVAELHLGRLEEAEAALKQALEEDKDDPDVIANLIVSTVLSGKDPADSISHLQNVCPAHTLLSDLEEKSALFDKAAAKYSAKSAA